MPLFLNLKGNQVIEWGSTYIHYSEYEDPFAAKQLHNLLGGTPFILPTSISSINCNFLETIEKGYDVYINTCFLKTESNDFNTITKAHPVSYELLKESISGLAFDSIEGNIIGTNFKVTEQLIARNNTKWAHNGYYKILSDDKNSSVIVENLRSYPVVKK